MPAERVLLDTNALIALGLGDEGVVARVRAAAWVGMPWIAAVEFRIGADPAAQRWFAEAIRLIEVVDTPYADTGLTDRIVAIRSRGRCKLPDAIILAVAQAKGAVLLTRDRHLLSAAAEVGAVAENWRSE